MIPYDSTSLVDQPIDPEDDPASRLRHQRLHPARLRALMKYCPPTTHPRVLDYGCATGEFVSKLRAAGYQAIGVDRNTDSIERAQKRFGDHFKFADSAESIDEEFDIIVLDHVLEHIQEPKNFLLTLKDRLTKEGALSIGVPQETSSWNFLLAPPAWMRKIDNRIVGYVLSLVALLDINARLAHFTNEHVSNFSAKTIRVLADQTGFEVMWLDTFLSGSRGVVELCQRHPLVGLVKPLPDFLLSRLASITKRGYYIETLLKSVDPD